MFLVNVKWVGRVNVLVHPKGPHKNITGPLWDLFGPFCFIIDRDGNLN